ncbi:hypothetical protein R1flu_013770 [Riccia fluitans]|uniref:Uncharacterized protein n=1 Tax=Riccia fluitans TaxID=41844 RepID=A0ABD1YFB6_9MARC
MATDELTNVKIGGESAAMTEELGRRRDYTEPPPAPLWDVAELKRWTLWRAAIVEFIATMLFVYVGVGAAIGNGRSSPDGVGMLGVAWSFGATIFILVDDDVSGHNLDFHYLDGQNLESGILIFHDLESWQSRIF